MRLPAKCDVRDAITPPPRSVRVPPVGGRPRGLTRVGCCESHRPSSRSVSVWASETFQSNRRNATVLSVVRSSERPWTCAGAPLAAASARNREAESGLTPSRVKVRGSAEASDGSACPRQRPCSAPNTNSLRSEEHTSELQSRLHLVCRLLLEKKKNTKISRLIVYQFYACYLRYVSHNTI